MVQSSYIYLQLSFQVVLVTDRMSSFAMIIYDNLATVQSLLSLGSAVQVGFNAGDRQRYLNVNSLQQVNVYRIDGM